MDYSPSDSVHQTRIPEGVAMPSSGGSSWPRDGTWVSSVSCTDRRVLYHQCHQGSPMLSTDCPNWTQASAINILAVWLSTGVWATSLSLHVFIWNKNIHLASKWTNHIIRLFLWIINNRWESFWIETKNSVWILSTNSSKSLLRTNHTGKLSFHISTTRRIILTALSSRLTMRMSQLCQERALWTLQALAMLPGVPGDAVFCASCSQLTKYVPSLQALVLSPKRESSFISGSSLELCFSDCTHPKRTKPIQFPCWKPKCVSLAPDAFCVPGLYTQ